MNKKARELFSEFIQEEEVSASLVNFLTKKVYTSTSYYKFKNKQDVENHDEPILSNNVERTDNSYVFKFRQKLDQSYHSVNVYLLYKNPVEEFQRLNNQNIQEDSEINHYVKFFRTYKPKLGNNYNSQLIINRLIKEMKSSSKSVALFMFDDLVELIKKVNPEIFKNDPSIIENINYLIEKNEISSSIQKEILPYFI